ncbi:HAMP domain-containing histidine kinase [Fulvivirgaceae bacterium PWU5]|uniref:histidine kinase n=1 Tax=Dawidia cretensis TaxID=2782350 RepID=A0AAP2E0H1_9BACT|nr:HAMP domain-containing sensor histidine kinase [Dawidia cretensis]MBT1709234.1 HAMP domain-containing histidine kinase [Dawidia cretensis]
MRSGIVKLIIAFVVFLVAGLVSVYTSNQSDTRSTTERLSARLARAVENTGLELAEVDARWQRDSVLAAPKDSYRSFFLYNNGQVVAWTDNSFVPTYASVSDTFLIKLLKAGNSDYLAQKRNRPDGSVLIGIVPLYRRYAITNNYLNASWNTRLFPNGNVTILEPSAPTGIPVCIQGHCPFKVNFPDGLPAYQRTRVAAVILLALAMLMLYLLLYQLAVYIPYGEVAVALLYLAFLGIRQAMVHFNFPATILASDAFNPQVFASDSLNASLGDLVLNELSLLVVCVFVFRQYVRFKGAQWRFRYKAFAWLWNVVCALCVLFALLFPFVVIQTLYNNSSLSLDIAQLIQPDAMKLMAFTAVLLSGICTFYFAHAFIRLLAAERNRLRLILSFLVAVAIFAGINTLTGQEFRSTIVTTIIYVTVVYSLRLYASLRRLGFATFAYLFIAVFVLAANGAYTLQYFAEKEKIEHQFRFAADFLIERDYFGEYLLAETANDIAQDVFIQTRLGSPFLSRDAIRQKIRQVFMPVYFNKYDVDIYLFSTAGEPLSNYAPVTFSELLAQYNQDAYRTDYAGVYYVSDPTSDAAQQYLVRVPIRRNGTIVGYVVLELSLKKVIPESVYPELLVDKRIQQFYENQELSYAVLAGNRILYTSGNYNYDQQFDIAWLGSPEIHQTGIEIDGYDHIAQEDSNGRVAVVTSQHEPWMARFADFSFLMTLGLMLILIFIVVQGVVNYIQGDKLYFSARIQLLLNASFFLPLIIVSVVTLQLISRSSQNQLNEEYLSKARSVGQQLAGFLSDAAEGTGESGVGFENQVASLAALANLDVNVYTPDGQLRATSQPLIVENDIVSHYMNPQAWQKVKAGERLFIEQEQIGSLEYSVSYAALKSPVTGELTGILGIPFFRSAASLEKVQINILATILNIFTIIFMALVVLAYFVSKWLTFPLEFITQSLRKTSLTKTNQPLVWRSDDEIGMMVKEYNQMLYNLSESKAELEQTQRERTWREIAQQVAHEIKNPLTPMKLTLQQLERSVQGGTASPEKTGKAVSSLLTQVDTLNDIASSFSAFAKMPEPVNTRFELMSLVRRIVDLHSHSGVIHFREPFKEVFVVGDEALLGRTFSNIILNAFQAARFSEPVSVHVSLQKTDAGIVITFQDNGKGIEPEVADRIFFPHFTTKQSGSGLGLAIAKQAIEQMKGRIWFETELGRGTTFFIELPVSQV